MWNYAGRSLTVWMPCLKNRTGVVYALARAEKEGWQEDPAVELRTCIPFPGLNMVQGEN